MKISVFGLGHVGLVTAAVLADYHTVYGVDIAPAVLETVKQARAPFHEPELDHLLRVGLDRGRLRVTADAAEAIAHTALSLVCVGTPQSDNGEADLTAVKRVLAEIGAALQQTDAYHVVVIRSTVPPTAWPTLGQHLETASGKRVGLDFGLCANPEFLREGQAVADFYHPPFVVIGHQDARAGYLAAAIYDRLHLPLITTTPEAAMLLKYTCNTWHALKVAFANEIGAVAAHLGLDGGEVMNIFKMDDRLNISPAYLHPGGPYGGPCLPKDVAALNRLAAPVGAPLLNAIAWSNQAHLQDLVDRALVTDHQRFAIVGLSFKPRTSDLRDSPAVNVLEALRAAGREVRVYDPDVPPVLAEEYAPLVSTWEALDGWAEAWILCKPSLASGLRFQGKVIEWM